MFGLGTTELLILGGIVLLLFGTRLPKVMRSLGEGIVEFKRGVQGIEDGAAAVSPATPTPASPLPLARPPEVAFAARSCSDSAPWKSSSSPRSR
jgi:sec-independent protein translocase protein TatA